MAWKVSSEDGMIEIVVDPAFQGDLIGLAAVRPVWIVDTDGNKSMIDAVWATGKDSDSFEVSRCPYPNPHDRRGNLIDILGLLDDHDGHYKGFVLHGIRDSREIRRLLDTEGFRIDATNSDGFSALMIPLVRGALIGRDYSQTS